MNFFTDPHPTAIEVWRKQAAIILEQFRYNQIKLNRDTFEPLIYDLQHPLKFVAPKSRQAAISRRDRFIFKYMDTPCYKIFNEGLTRFYNALPPNRKENLP